MSGPADGLIVDTKGAAAPPRVNGELAFDQPWESRAFGLAVALCQGGHYEWVQFRARLIDEIASWDVQSRTNQERWSYYDCWLAALERLVVDEGLLGQQELWERAVQVADDAEHEHDAHDHDRVRHRD